jgi:hypothetical protein
MVMQGDKKPVVAIGPYWIWTYLDISVNANQPRSMHDSAANPFGAGNTTANDLGGFMLMD